MLQSKKVKMLAILLVTFVLAAIVGCNGTPDQLTTTNEPSKTATLWNVDNIPVGKLPAGWNVDATNQKGPLATWEVITDTTAPSGDQVLALTHPNHTYGRTFNICWMDTISFLDGEIQVQFKAISGEEDQGGGVMWRVQDENNYYIARFNPLEDNFRFYTVYNSVRTLLADSKITLSPEKWHTLKIVQNGNKIEGYLDGNKLFDHADDLFTEAGGVGLWTKADAVTSFDDFTVRPLKK